MCNMMLIPVMRNYFIHNCALFSLLYPDGAALYTTVSLLTDRNNRPLHGYKKRTLTMVPSKVLSGLWVLQEKVDTRVSTFSLPNHFLFLGIYGIIELSKDERR